MTKLFLSVPEATQEYVPSLDGLRAISILLVMTQHIVSVSFPGGYGVWLFFVISGYLISRLLFSEIKSESRVNLFAFYKRRFFRIYPVVFIYTVVVVFSYSTTEKIDWMEPISVLTNWENFLGSVKDPLQMPFSIFWSLSMEEQFYAIFPILFIIVGGRPFFVLTISVFGVLFPLILRSIDCLNHPKLLNGHWFYFRTEYRIDAISFGIFFASICEIREFYSILKIISQKYIVIFAYIFAVLCIIVKNTYFKVTICYSLVELCFTIIISSVVNFDTFKFINLTLNSSPLVYVGKISYSLYVWHLGVVYLFKYVFPGGIFINECLYLK